MKFSVIAVILSCLMFQSIIAISPFEIGEGAIYSRGFMILRLIYLLVFIVSLFLLINNALKRKINLKLEMVTLIISIINCSIIIIDNYIHVDGLNIILEKYTYLLITEIFLCISYYFKLKGR